MSTAASLAHVRAAKAAGLPVTCDVTPHHLALRRRVDRRARGAGPGRRSTPDGRARDPWTDGALVAAPFDTSLRVNPPLRSAEDAAACLRRARATGPPTRSRPTTRPHTEVDKHVEFGWAINGISGIETALSVVLAAVAAGELPLARAVEALTTGPARRARGAGRGVVPGLREGEPADLVVVDAGATWTVDARTRSRSKGKNSPLLGRELPGVVRLVLARGRVAYVQP